ncbi:MAG: hypothetical protein PVI50_05235 [Gammaproteobacteria bacterium]|jgi:hypothetical protein
MNEPPARFEFRLFGQCFEQEEQRLRTMAAVESIVESRETYFLAAPPDPRRNVKLRDGQLELKRLVACHQGLERWRPAGQWALPVTSGTLLELLAPDNGTTWRHTLPALLDLGELLAFVARPEIPLYRAEVFKRRILFAPAGCRAELDQLLVNGAAIQSLAMEAGDPDAVLALRAALGIETRENTCYPRALSRIMGLDPLLHGVGHG